MVDEGDSFSQARENSDVVEHQERTSYNGVSLSKHSNDQPDSSSQRRDIFHGNSPRGRLDQGAENKLARYLEQMALKRGELGAILSGPKWALLPIARVQTTKFAEDDESKLLGNTLEDFFNTAPNIPSAPKTDDNNETAWKMKARAAQQARESWMAAWKAGKEWKGMPETPTKQSKAKAGDATSTQTTSLDDLRILIDIIAQEPKKSFDDNFTTTLARSLNDKAALEVIFTSNPTMARPEMLDPAVPSSDDAEEVLNEDFAALIPELPSPESELRDVSSLPSVTPEQTQPHLSSDALPCYEEAIDKTGTAKPSCSESEFNDVYHTPPNNTPVEALAFIAHSSQRSDKFVDDPLSAPCLKPVNGQELLRDLPTTSPVTSMLESNPVDKVQNLPASHATFTKRLPTLAEVLESLLNPSSEAAILEACGAVISEPVQDTSLNLTSTKLSAITQTASTLSTSAAPQGSETLSCVSLTHNTETGDNPLITGSGLEAMKSSGEQIIGIYNKNASSMEAALELFKQEDQEKILEIGKWGTRIKKLALFQTVEERDSIFADLPDQLKSGIGEDQSRPFVFKHEWSTPDSSGEATTSDSSERNIATLDDTTSYTAPSERGESTFTLFAKVPEKLRKKIWTYARPEPRLIKLCASDAAKSIFSTAPVPALLQTCRESRALAQSWYELSFSSLGSREPKVYFDFTRDGIYTRCRGCIGTNCLHKKTWTKDHEKVKLLAFEAPMSFKPFRKIAKFYLAVEELILIKGRSIIPRGEIAWTDLEEVEERFDWQGDEDDLARVCSRHLRDNEPKIAMTFARLGLLKVLRMTLPGVYDREYTGIGNGMWTCCQ